MNRKIALVTGGSRGLGRDMVINLAKAGHLVLFTYQKNEEKAKEVIQVVESMKQKAKAFTYDALNEDGGSALIQEVSQYLLALNGNPHFDFLINNAGIGMANAIEETTSQQFDELMQIHLKSVYFITQSALPYLNTGGSIVNISTGLTRFSFPGMSAYAMMKGGIEVFTRYLAKELGHRQITANVVAPGAIATDFAGGSNKEANKTKVISGITALGRVGEAEDVGGIIAFLCSDKARWINGQRLEASGGMLV